MLIPMNDDKSIQVVKYMEIVELALILLGFIALLVLSITTISKISVFYRNHFNFSIWSGILLMSVALVSLVIIGSDNTSKHPLVLVFVFLTYLLSLVQDIRLSGFTYGILGFIFQVIMTFAMFSLLIIVLACWLGRVITRSTRRLTTPLWGVANEIRYATILLPIFIKL